MTGPVTFDHDSPLGRWRQTDWSPPRLAGIVEKIWDFEGRTTFRDERAFPSGIGELIVHLGERYHESRGRQFDRCPALCLSGIQTGPFVVRSPEGPTTLLGIRLTAIGVFRVLGCGARQLTDVTVDLSDLVGSLARELEDAVGSAADGRRRVERAAEWVARRIGATAPIEPAIGWMAGRLEATHGAARVAALRNEIGISKHRVTALFRDRIGLSPKLYARVLRFRRALSLMGRGSPSLGRVAAASGYYDQPHLNAEFRELAGMTPTEYLGRIRYETGVNLAE